jgi:hypothetical protein
VKAVLLGGEQLAADVGDRDLVLVDVERSNRPRRDLFEAAYLSIFGLLHPAEGNKAENALA